MKKDLFLTILLVLITSLGFSQKDKFWAENTESRSSITKSKGVARLSFPKVFKLFNLNTEALRQELFTIVGNSSKHSTIISLPDADGHYEQFEVFEASNFEPDLQAKFPEIRAYSGKGITDKYATLKLSISPQGISTMVSRAEKQTEFSEPYSSDRKVYAVYKSQREKGKLPWTCTTDDKQMAAEYNAKIHASNFTQSSTGELKTLRLAQSCNGEYANYFGATSSAQVGLVLAAFNATLTRCNGVYEKELAVHLSLISQTTDVIYYNPATDPYTTWNVGNGFNNWNKQLMKTLHNIIGDANFDIGHMFGRSGGGGNAGCIGCVCSNVLSADGGPNDSYKGAGITSPADDIPEGDAFDIEFVVHEVGHQLGACHTFSFYNEGFGTNKEVGSGVTIMSYAGVTTYDVAPYSTDVYHEVSIEQIQNNLANKTCPVVTNITANNATPVVAPVSNYIIPISTPFALTGSATDANNDPLTYCWEQNDNTTSSTVGSSSSASPTKLTGPNFLSWNPATSPTRLFPKLSTILAGGFTTEQVGGDAGMLSEALSSVSRTLNFRLTVRDNSPYVPVNPGPAKVGQTAFTDMVVTVTNTSGPFMVTTPNTNVSWPAGSTQTITWDVANTTNAPVSCANVNILLSTDGGQTFPIVLVASTANDGSETVTIPSIAATSTARVKIESVGNIFFDISNSDFNITEAAGSFDFTTPTPATVSCVATTAAYIKLPTVSNGGYVVPIDLSATGNPAGTIVTYGMNPVTPGNSTVVTLTGVNTLAPGSYPITITGVSGAITKTVTLTYTVSPGTGPSITTQPIAMQVCEGLNTNFTVTATNVNSYQWQVSTDGGGSWNNISNTVPYSDATTATLMITGATAVMNTYQYRAILNGQCGTSISDAATLTVNPLPTVIAGASSASVCSGTQVTLIASGADTYAWSTGTIPATGAIVNATPTITTTYTVTGTITATGCISTASTTVTATAIGDSASSKLFMYPSPNTGKFTVAYYNADGATTHGITIYDSKGVRVFNKTFAVTQTYQSLPVNLHNVGHGVYYIVLRNASGKKIKTGQVAIQ